MLFFGYRFASSWRDINQGAPLHLLPVRRRDRCLSAWSAIQSRATMPLRTGTKCCGSPPRYGLRPSTLWGDRLQANLMPAENAYDLIFGKSAWLHHSPSSDELTYQWQDFCGNRSMPTCRIIALLCSVAAIDRQGGAGNPRRGITKQK